MKEMNEKFPQMKSFAESLEKIQSLGGLPSINENMMVSSYDTMIFNSSLSLHANF